MGGGKGGRRKKKARGETNDWTVHEQDGNEIKFIHHPSDRGSSQPPSYLYKSKLFSVEQ